MTFVLLEDRSVFFVQGDGSFNFLQSLLSADIKNCPTYCFLLSPKGKILYDFFVYSVSNSEFILDCSSTYVDEILVVFNRYKLRSKVEFIKKENLGVVIALKDTDYQSNQNNYQELKVFFTDPRSGAFGKRGIIDKSTTLNIAGNISVANIDIIDRYRALHCELLCPQFSYDFYPDEFIPIHLELDKFNTISYNKGCYVGQEVVTRLKFIGESRKKLCRVALIVERIVASEFAKHGDDVYSESVNDCGSKIGIVLGVYGKELLVQLRKDSIVGSGQMYMIGNNSYVLLRDKQQNQ